MFAVEFTLFNQIKFFNYIIYHFLINYKYDILYTETSMLEIAIKMSNND